MLHHLHVFCNHVRSSCAYTELLWWSGQPWKRLSPRVWGLVWYRQGARHTAWRRASALPLYLHASTHFSLDCSSRSSPRPMTTRGCLGASCTTYPKLRGLRCAGHAEDHPAGHRQCGDLAADPGGRMTRLTVHRQDHPLAQAHSPTPAQSGTVVYVICGYEAARSASCWRARSGRRSCDGASGGHTPAAVPGLGRDLGTSAGGGAGTAAGHRRPLGGAQEEDTP